MSTDEFTKCTPPWVNDSSEVPAIRVADVSSRVDKARLRAGHARQNGKHGRHNEANNAAGRNIKTPSFLRRTTEVFSGKLWPHCFSKSICRLRSRTWWRNARLSRTRSETSAWSRTAIERAKPGRAQLPSGCRRLRSLHRHRRSPLWIHPDERHCQRKRPLDHRAEYRHAKENDIPRLMFLKDENVIPYTQTDAKSRSIPPSGSKGSGRLRTPTSAQRFLRRFPSSAKGC